jgi:hypothetical protein
MYDYLKYQSQDDVPPNLKTEKSIRLWRMCCIRMAEICKIRHLVVGW